MISKKILLATSALIVAGTLVGCNTISEREEVKAPGDIQESTASISDEAFAKALDAYLEKNKIAFGEKVITAANAFQEEQQKNKSAEKQAKMKNVPATLPTDHTKGSSSPEFILYEYTDFNCPYCQKFHPIGEEFVKKNPNVQLVFRPLPFKGTPLHEIAECVAKVSGNDAFWKFADAAFSNAITVENYETALAQYNIAGADSIKTCYTSGEMKASLEKAIKDGMDLGVEGTPNSILKNVKTGEIVLLEGARPLADLEKAMDTLKK